MQLQRDIGSLELEIGMPGLGGRPFLGRELACHMPADRQSICAQPTCSLIARSARVTGYSGNPGPSAEGLAIPREAHPLLERALRGGLP